MKDVWKLTDEERAEVAYRNGDMAEAQEAKKQSYRDMGHIILNPDALEDMYEAIRWTLEDYRDKRANTQLAVSTHTQLLKALAKAEGVR